VSLARIFPRIAVLAGALLLTTTGLVACGSDNAAVRVEGRAIAAPTVSHWMSVIAGEVSTASGRPEPPVPTPPHYTACIAYRRQFPTAFANGNRTLSVGVAKRECSLEFQKEKLKALYFLISSDWVAGEGAVLGVNLTRKEVAQQLAQLQGAAPNKAQVRRFLIGTRGTTADLLMRLKLTLLSARIQKKLEVEDSAQHLTTEQRQAELQRFGKEFTKRWKNRTDCHTGYVVPLCRDYKTPKTAPVLTPPQVPLANLTAASE
jgi:surface antigen